MLATVLKRADLTGAPTPRAVAVRVGRNIVIVPERTPTPMIRGSRGPSDDGLVKVGGELAVDGVPRGAGQGHSAADGRNGQGAGGEIGSSRG